MDLRPDDIVEAQEKANVEIEDIEDPMEGRSLDELFEDADKEAFIQLWNALWWDADIDEEVSADEGRSFIRKIR